MSLKKSIPAHIDSNGIHCWSFSLDLTHEQQQTYLNLLSQDERKRAGKYRFEKDRRTYIVSKGILRLLSSNYLGRDPIDIQFQYSDFGKPTFLQNSDLKFNVSHSGKRVLIGFSKDLAIGVDIEKIKQDFDVLELAEHSFSKEEIRALSAYRSTDRYRAFYRCWTRKESFIKAVGEGLSYPLDSFAVTLDDDIKAEFLRIDGPSEKKSHWCLRSFIPAEGYMAAITTDGRPAKIEFFDWDHGIID